MTTYGDSLLTAIRKLLIKLIGYNKPFGTELQLAL